MPQSLDAELPGLPGVVGPRCAKCPALAVLAAPGLAPEGEEKQVMLQLAKTFHVNPLCQVHYTVGTAHAIQREMLNTMKYAMC